MKRSQLILAAAVAVLVALLAGGWWYVGYANRTHPAPWPMVQGSAGSRWAAPAPFPQEPALLFAYPLEHPSIWVLLDADQTVYTTSGNQVLAVDAGGTKRWSWQGRGEIRWIVLGRHDTLYTLDGEDELVALDLRGRVKWRRTVPANWVDPPVVGQGGALYAIIGGRLTAFDAEGNEKWSYRERVSGGWPVEMPDGTLLVPNGELLEAFSPTGSLLWSRRLGRLAGFATMAVDKKGQIWYRSSEALTVMNREGNILAEARRPMSGRAITLAVGDGVAQDGPTRWDQRGQVVSDLPALRGDLVFTWIDPRGNLLITQPSPVNMQRARPDGPSVAVYSIAGERLWGYDQGGVAGMPGFGSDGRICMPVVDRTTEKPALVCLGEAKGR